MKNSRKDLDLGRRFETLCRSDNRMPSGVMGKMHEPIATHVDHRRTNQKSRNHSDLNVMTKMDASGSYDLVTWTNERLRYSCDLDHLCEGHMPT